LTGGQEIAGSNPAAPIDQTSNHAGRLITAAGFTPAGGVHWKRPSSRSLTSRSLWIAKMFNVRSDPGTDPVCWQLAVKRGADGKDAKPRAVETVYHNHAS
jgi:hypothetical protein